MTEAVNLSNCDREPIHIPGLIQPHGALLALDDQQRVVYASDNLAAVLGDAAPALGQLLTASHFEGRDDVHGLIAQALAAAPDENSVMLHTVVPLGGRVYDLLVHRQRGPVLIEFEQQPAGAAPRPFGPRLLDATQRFRAQPSIQALLEQAVLLLRQMTGFDRVMAYRFRPDDSGDIVAEDKLDSLPPYLGMRYPASDIPAQARRLYTINLMRLIADVNAPPVPVQALDAQAAPLDMSHAVLRSVSPVHLEYLRNIGVAGSMSLSIVIDGRLWGMLACHHGQPLHVPYVARAACGVLAEMLAANVQTHRVAERAAETAALAHLRDAVLDGAQHATHPSVSLRAQAAEMTRLFDADALLGTGLAGAFTHGELDESLHYALLDWLQAQDFGDTGVIDTQTLRSRAPELAPLLGSWAGLLAMRFDEGRRGLLALLRREQIEHVRWGHEPAKAQTIGPLGARLTPPGSFAEWRETVRDTAAPWTDTQRAAMQNLRADLSRFITARLAELLRQRATVTDLLQRGEGGAGDADDSHRVNQLLQQVHNLALMQQGHMSLAREPMDLAALAGARTAEARRRHTGLSLFFDRREAALNISADPKRLTRLIDSLIDNAVQHGEPGESVVLRVQARGSHALLEVSNVAAPIAEATLEKLFSLDASSAAEDDIRAGLGFGLAIDRAVAQAHGGDLSYRYDEPFVTLVLQLPLAG